MSSARKVIATVEARMASTRLPRESMEKIMDRPVLELVIERLARANTIDEIVVATTVNPKDNEIVRFCNKNEIAYHRGSEDDVLGRVLETAIKYNGDIIVQCGADCPFYDPSLVDKLVNIFMRGNYDYVCSDMKLTYPLGVYAHVMSIEVLEEIAKMRNMLKQVSKEYSDVEFKYCNAVEAMRKVISIDKIFKPDFEVQIDIRGQNRALLEIESKNKIFGPQPFLAIKTKSNQYFWDNLDFQGSNKWSYTFDYNTLYIDAVDKVGVAANTENGVTEVVVLNISKKNKIERNILNL